MINNKMINIGLLLVAIFTLIAFVLNRPIQELIDRLFFKKLINIEIVDDTEMRFGEIDEYCKNNRIENFFMNLDDSMSDLYNVVKIKIHNKGVSIDDNIAFKLRIDNKYTKIIDIQIPIAVESNSFSHELPEWIWDYEKASKKDHRFKFSWRPAKEDDVIGVKCKMNVHTLFIVF